MSESSLHIGFLTPEYPTESQPHGGLANYIRKIGTLLLERGHKVSVIVLSSQNAHWNDNGLEVHKVRDVRWGKQVSGQFFLIPLLSRVFAAYRIEQRVRQIHKIDPFDLLQASNYKAPGFTLRKNEAIPVVCRISSYGPLLRAANGQQRSFLSTLTDWLEIRQVLDVNAAFAPSALLSNTFEKFESATIQVIRTPLDPMDIPTDDSFYKTRLDGMKYLLYFGGLRRLKGVDVLARALMPVLSEHPDLQGVFIGPDDHGPDDDSPSMVGYIMEQARSYGVLDQVHCFEPLPRDLLFPVIEHALAVAMPSRVDNSPNACLEAQSMGRIVIGTYNSSLDEMIVDGETGFLAQNGDVQDLQRVLASFLALPADDILRLENNVLHHVEQIRAEDRVAELEEFYHTLLRAT